MTSLKAESDLFAYVQQYFILQLIVQECLKYTSISDCIIVIYTEYLTNPYMLCKQILIKWTHI